MKKIIVIFSFLLLAGQNFVQSETLPNDEIISAQEHAGREIRFAISVLKAMALAAESYAAVNGHYLQSMMDLIDSDLDYFGKEYRGKNYCNQTISSFKYTCEMSLKGYKFIGYTDCGKSGHDHFDNINRKGFRAINSICSMKIIGRQWFDALRLWRSLLTINRRTTLSK